MPPYRLGLSRLLGAGYTTLLVLAVPLTPVHGQSLPAQATSVLPKCAADEPNQNGAEDRNNPQPVFIGLTASGDLMEVRSTSDGNWRIVLTLQDGSSCTVASGNGWETVERPVNSLLEPSNSRTRVD